MAERKAIPKTLRFDVFARDKFTCQYCGRMSPDVVLEIDHIQPVSKGGKNELLNLVTSCRDCNRGKSNKTLSENSAVKRQQNELCDMAERLEQAKMMIEWKENMIAAKTNFVDVIIKLIESMTSYSLNDDGKRGIFNLISRFSFEEVYEATEISFTRYYAPYKDDEKRKQSFNFACSKIGGICYNKRKQKEAVQYGET
jgi:hypothetical protein